MITYLILHFCPIGYRALNIGAFALHAGAVTLCATSLDKFVRKTQIKYDDIVLVDDFDIMILLLFFSAFTAAAHFFYAAYNVPRTCLTFRFSIEYPISASVMAVIISMLCREQQIMVLAQTFVLIATTMHFGFLQEREWFRDGEDEFVRLGQYYRESRQQRHGYDSDEDGETSTLKSGSSTISGLENARLWGDLPVAQPMSTHEVLHVPLQTKTIAFWMGCIPYAAAWAAILVRYFQNTDVPTFVHAIIIVEVVLFSSFAAVQYWYCRNLPTPTSVEMMDYLYIELSFWAKFMLVILAYFGVRAQA